MKAVIDIVLFAFLVLLSSIELTAANQLTQMLERYSQSRPISQGIHYFTNERGEYFPLPSEYFSNYKVVKNGFIIGVSDEFRLRPIYDINARMVVVRLRDYTNIEVQPYDVPKFHFHSNLPFNPESSSQGRQRNRPQNAAH